MYAYAGMIAINHLADKLPKLKEDFLEDMLSLLPYITEDMLSLLPYIAAEDMLSLLPYIIAPSSSSCLLPPMPMMDDDDGDGDGDGDKMEDTIFASLIPTVNDCSIAY